MPKYLLVIILILAALILGYLFLKNSLPVDLVTKNLNFSNKNLSTVNTKIFNDSQIEILDLSNNNLTGALPSEIGKLKNLRILIAKNNQLTGIPAEIGQLTRLEEIDFSGNQIDSMPNEIANLKNSLKILNLSGNKYSPEYQARIKAMLPLTTITF